MKTLLSYLLIFSLMQVGFSINAEPPLAGINSFALSSLDLDLDFSPDLTLSATNTYVTKVQADGKILAGGDFGRVNGQICRGVTRLNSDGTQDPTFNAGGSGLSGFLEDLLILPDGKILIAGSFSSYNGVSVRGLARLNSDGTLDSTFNPSGSGADGTVKSIALQPDGKILGTTSTTYNGNISRGVFRANSDGTFDPGFVSGFAPADGGFSIYKLLIQSDGSILIGGVIQKYGGTSVSNLIRVTSTGSLDFSFPIGLSPPNLNYVGVHSLAVQFDQKILIGGLFISYAGSSRTMLVRVDQHGVLDPNFATQNFVSPATVRDITVLPDGRILALGSFGYNGGFSTPLVEFSPNGTINRMSPTTVDSLAHRFSIQTDGRIVIAGAFSRTGNGALHEGLVRLNQDWSLDAEVSATLNTSFSQVRTVVQQPDGKILVGGTFRRAGNAACSNIVRLNNDGSIDSTFDAGFGTTVVEATGARDVYDIALQPDGKILVGGIFGGFNGMPRPSIVRLNPDGSVDKSFELTGNIRQTSPTVVRRIMVLPTGKILIGGDLYDPNISPHGIFRLNPNGSVDTTFNSGRTAADGAVWGIEQQPDGKILIFGTFGVYNSVPGRVVVRINEDGSIDPTFSTAITSGGASAAVIRSDGSIIMAGSLSFGNGPSRKITKFFPNGTLDTSLSDFGNNTGFTDLFLLAQDRVLVGGTFNFIFQTQTPGLAVFKMNGDLDQTFISGLSSFLYVYRIEGQSDGKILVAGSFGRYNGLTRNNLLRLMPSQTTTNVNVGGKVTTPTGIGLRNAVVTLTEPSGARRQTLTSSFGNYLFENVPSSQDYVITASSKRYRFSPKQLFILTNVNDVDFSGLE